VAGRGAARARPAARRAPDRHFLRSAAVAEAIVADARIAADDLVVDIGAGGGRLTAPLARTGAEVWAIELDGELARVLRRRFAGAGNVRVIEGDALRVALPRRTFRVVANVPFGSTTAILRRLLEDPRLPVAQADVIVEWGLARKRAACWPSTQLGITWAAWHELALVRRLPARCFEPKPGVDAGLLRATRRREPLVAERDASRFGNFVRVAFAEGLPRSRAARRCLDTLGLDRRAQPRDLDVHQWAALFDSIRRNRYAAVRT
jgi:16S rRNA A1518/A1519 N6-dimethyltransferase RsmA/KsgA/DIM1 with predicted DNA glycosylase/AP lyase activity